MVEGSASSERGNANKGRDKGNDNTKGTGQDTIKGKDKGNGKDKGRGKGKDNEKPMKKPVGQGHITYHGYEFPFKSYSHVFKRGDKVFFETFRPVPCNDDVAQAVGVKPLV